MVGDILLTFSDDIFWYTVCTVGLLAYTVKSYQMFKYCLKTWSDRNDFCRSAYVRGMYYETPQKKQYKCQFNINIILL